MELERKDIEIIERNTWKCSPPAQMRKVKITFPTGFDMEAGSDTIPVTTFGFRKVFDISPAISDSEDEVFQSAIVDNEDSGLLTFHRRVSAGVTSQPEDDWPTLYVIMYGILN